MKTKPYACLFGPIIRKWDWFIYGFAFHSLRRMSQDMPGMSYLMELQIRHFNQHHTISPELKSATEMFYNSLTEKHEN